MTGWVFVRTKFHREVCLRRGGTISFPAITGREEKREGRWGRGVTSGGNVAIPMVDLVEMVTDNVYL